MDQLGVQFSCSNHVRRATELHSFYSNKINKRQREMGHEPLDLEGPLYKCAALVAAAKVNCRGVRSIHGFHVESSYLSRVYNQFSAE